MADSSSFSSLFALVDSHLSRSNIQDQSQPSTSGLGSFRFPPPNIPRGQSDTGLPSTSGLSSSSSMRFPLPSMSFGERPIHNPFKKSSRNFFHASDSDEESPENPTTSMSDHNINDVLALQLSNMFKAREAKEEEERRKKQELQRVEENMANLELEESSCLIDLMPAVQLPGQVQSQAADTLSSGSSTESLAIPDASDIVEDDGPEQLDLEDRSGAESPKPIAPDMRYILKHKLGKCSAFGKVLCARYRPVAAPYLREYVHNPNIKVFDFSTPSPDDMVMERLRKPSYYNAGRTISVYD